MSNEINQQLLRDIEENLKGLLQPNNELITLATANLDRLLKPSNSSRYLFLLLQNSTFLEIRQLCAILLRQKLKDHWIKLEKTVRFAMKQLVIQLIISEPVSLVKKSISELIISISRLELAADTWPELFPFLVQLSNSNDTILIQIQLHIFESIFDNNVPISQHVKEIYAILNRLILSNDLTIRSAAVKASGSAVSSLLPPSKKSIFYPLIPLMIESIKLFIQNHMEGEVISAFEIFIDLAETINNSVVEYLTMVCQLSFEILNSNLDYSYKTSSVEFLDTIIKHKPGFFKKTKLLDQVLQILYSIMTMDDNDTDENIYQSAGIAIRECGQKYKSTIVYSQAIPLLKQYQLSTDPNVRKASIAIIQQLSYGCNETMKDDMDTIMSFVISGLKDQSKVVRQYSCVCIGILAQNLHPDIYKYTSIVFPLIFESINDSDDEFVLRCCYALEQFLFNLENNIVLPIMRDILDKLFQLINRPNIQVKEFALSAISALVMATELNFEPYFDVVFNLIQPFLTLQEKEASILKANAFDCLGTLIKAVPKEKFKPHIPMLFNVAFKQVESKPDPEVIESCFGCYSHLFERYGEEVAEFLPMIHDQIIKAAQSDEAIVKHKDNNIVQGISHENEEEEEDDDDIQGISIYTPLLDQKVAAIHCLGVLATNLPKTYFSFCSAIVPLIEALCQYFHEDVRDEALILTQALLIPVNANNPSGEWKVGDYNHKINPNTKVLLDFSFQIYSQILTFETDKVVTARAFECIANTVKILGPASIGSYLNEIGTFLMKCFNSGLYCQTVNAEETPELDEHSDDENDDGIEEDSEEQEEYIEDEDEENDLRLLDLATECFIQICSASGPQFKVYLEAAIPILLKLTKSSVHHSIRSIVIGTIAESIRVLNTDFSSFYAKLLPLGLKWIKDEEEDMLQVTTYLLGILIQRSVVATAQDYEQVLQSISGLLLKNNSDLPNEVIDNTVGCLARVMSTNINFVPNLEKVIPIFFSKLPIRKEITEVEPVINTIILLMASKPELISAYMQQIISIFSIDLSREKLEASTKKIIIQSLKSLIEKHQNQIQQLILNLPEQQQRTLQLYLS